MKKGYKLEMCFSFTEENGTRRVMWCCGKVKHVRGTDNKEVKVKVNWDKEFVACGQNKISEETLKKGLWNPEKPRREN